MKSFRELRKQLKEDGAITNCVAGGAVAGIGINNPSIPNQAEPGIKKKKKLLTLKQMLTRVLPK